MRVLITPATSFFIYLLTFPHSEGEDSAEAEVGGKERLIFVHLWPRDQNSHILDA